MASLVNGENKMKGKVLDYSVQENSGLIAFIEGVMYLTKTDEEFEEIYVQGEKSWF